MKKAVLALQQSGGRGWLVECVSDPKYTASIQLRTDAFISHLHHTEDLFTNPSIAVPLVSLPHRFHSLDRVVEEVLSKKRAHGTVIGMLFVS